MRVSTLALKVSVAVCMLGVAIGAMSSATIAQEIYGSQLMTFQERAEYRERLRNTQSAEERERIRREHHTRMQERARARGVKIPETAPPQGMRRGIGSGDGTGMGPEGSGQRRRRGR